MLDPTATIPQPMAGKVDVPHSKTEAKVIKENLSLSLCKARSQYGDAYRGTHREGGGSNESGRGYRSCAAQSERGKKRSISLLFSVLPELCSNRLRTLGHFGGRLSTGFPLPKVE